MIYRQAEKKSIQIGEIETLLKSNSIDCNILKEINYSKDDKPFSKVCSYQPECKYSCNSKKTKTMTKLNYDTLNLQTFYPLLIQISDYISDLYKNTIALQLEDILKLLLNDINVDIYIIYLALEFMMNEKYTIKNNENTGYLIYNNKYYIFQPFNRTDRTIPIYYRFQKYNKHKNYHDLIKSKKTIKKYNTPDMNEKIKIDKTPSLKDNKLIKLYNFDEYILFSYDIERLTFTQKASLLKDIILKIPNLDKLETYIFNHYRRNFIYYSTTYEMDKLYDKNIKPKGFYLYNEEYFFFLLDEHDRIYEVDDVTNLNLIEILKDYSKTDIYKNRYKNFPPVWGYNYIQSKKIITAIDCKIVKWFSYKNKKIKKIGDGGPGYQCNSNSQLANPEFTLELIKVYFKDYYIDELLGTKFKVSKRIICILFELILRNEQYKDDSVTYFYNYDNSFLLDF